MFWVVKGFWGCLVFLFFFRVGGRVYSFGLDVNLLASGVVLGPFSVAVVFFCLGFRLQGLLGFT